MVPPTATASPARKSPGGNSFGFNAQYSPKVDEYIAAAARFAQPILNHMRQSVHKAIEWIAEGKRRNWKYESC